MDYHRLEAHTLQFSLIELVSFSSFNLLIAREANIVAHILARNSFDSNSVIICVGDPPEFLLAEVVRDVNHHLSLIKCVTP